MAQILALKKSFARWYIESKAQPQGYMQDLGDKAIFGIQRSFGLGKDQVDYLDGY